jgi:hypothetical protein
MPVSQKLQQLYFRNQCRGIGMHKHSTSLTLLLCAALFVSCSSKPSDETIAKNIQAKITTSLQTQDSEVAVAVDHGKVTLRGQAKSRSAQEEIARMAKEEPGVNAVDDQLSVESAKKAKAVAVNTEPVAAPAAAPPPPPKPSIVPAGTVLTIRTNEALATKSAQPGMAFTGSLATPISIEGKMVLPAGSDVTGIVKDAKKAGKFKGEALLVLTLNSVIVNGHHYNIETEYFDKSNAGKGKRTAGVIVGGTGLGAAIGGIAGGGKGAAIGAVAGAVAGTVGAGATGNRNFELPAESALTFKLVQPLTLRPESASQQVGQ